MPNQRAPGQKLLPIAVDEKFLRELDAGLIRAGYRNRSQFIRDAIVEKLLRSGIILPPELALPPQRMGRSNASPLAAAKIPSPSPEANERTRAKKRSK